MPRGAALRMYGQPSATPRLDWAWVDAQLEAAGTYWVVARTPGHPHPRPVWGVWDSDHLYLSIGTPVTLRTLAAGRGGTASSKRDGGTSAPDRVPGPWAPGLTAGSGPYCGPRGLRARPPAGRSGLRPVVR